MGVNRRMIEHTRGQNGDVGATFHPDHFAPMTWHRCVTTGCNALVDPWDHNTRCTEHRPPPDHRGDDDRARRLEVARAIVRANRESIEL